MAGNLSPDHPKFEWKPQHVSKEKYKVGSQKVPGVLELRPEHAMKMMMFISTWSCIEHYMTEIVAYLVEAEGWIVAELLVDIRKFQVKRKFVVDIVGAKLGPTMKRHAEQVFLFTLLKDLQTERDNIAHGLFLVPMEYPDMVIRCDGYGNREAWYGYSLDLLSRMKAKFDLTASQVSDLWLQCQFHSPKRQEVSPGPPQGHPPSSDNRNPTGTPQGTQGHDLSHLGQSGQEGIPLIFQIPDKPR